MTTYHYKNIDNGIVTIYDSEGNGHTLYPGDTVGIDRKINAEGNGVIYTTSDQEQYTLKEEKPIKRKKKISKEDD